MNFSIIFSVDVPGDTSIRQYLPNRRIRRQLTQTEGDEQYDYKYLEGCWKKGKHRKLCGILNRKDFDQLVEDLSMWADSTETMGSLGAPGFGMGWAPAISFIAEHYDAIMSMYVTPIPDCPPPEGDEALDRAWKRIKKAVVSVYSLEGQYRGRLRLHKEMIDHDHEGTNPEAL